jgi:hypothetical protein
LQDEAAQPLLLIGYRGERAGIDHLCTNLESGKVSVSQLANGRKQTGLWDDITDFFAVDVIRPDHVWLLQYLTKAVEIAKGPVERYGPLMNELEATVKDAPGPLAKLLAPALKKIATVAQRSQASLQCAVTALAAERYRRDKQRWPDSLHAMVPEYLPKVAKDPFDGAPLRFGKHKEGVVIYSVGPDCKDNGGNINRAHPMESGTDIGFQLWDVSKRRQAPKPRRKRQQEPRDGLPPGLVPLPKE